MSSRRGSRRKISITPKRGSRGGYSISSKLPKATTYLFYNRTYLYFISIFSIIYFLGHAINRDYVSLLVFMITSIITYENYSKNMSIVLTISCISSILITSIYLTVSPTYTKEGMETKETPAIDEPTPDPKQPSKEKQPVKKNKPLEEKQSDKETQSVSEDTIPKNVENLSPLQPAAFQKNKRGGDFDIDLASTLEQSYGMLNNLLDNDGISNLTDETKRSINEQKKLFQSMNSMAPLIGQAKEMLGMFNTKDFKQMEGLAQTTMQNLKEKRDALPTAITGK
jgi:hypothetical protein